jgi:hypothetical protein
MTTRRRGIRLKDLSRGDPGLESLRDSQLGAEHGKPEPPHPPVPPPAEVAREVLQVLEETLPLLETGPPSRPREGPPEGSPAAGESAAPQDPAEPDPDQSPAAPRTGRARP